MDAFEKNIDEKSQYIDKIVFLDDGFEEIYTRVKRRTGWKQSCIYGRDSEDERSDLYDHRTQHEDPGSGAAQQRACGECSSQRHGKKIRQVKAGNKAATQYYKNMQQMDAIPPQFLDKKK